MLLVLQVEPVFVFSFHREIHNVHDATFVIGEADPKRVTEGKRLRPFAAGMIQAIKAEASAA